jgi:alginate O-acetyltransferase complex protein AlgI
MVDFSCALKMQAGQECNRKLWLLVSIFTNLSVLCIFKYADFFIRSANRLVADGSELIPLLNLTLPVGISFYTFQSMSYTIDVYRKHLQPTRNPIQFFAYLSFFPQLVAGPIVRASDLLWQLTKPIVFEDSRIWSGTKLIAKGMFKKMLLADNLATSIDLAFTSDATQGGLFWWLIMGMFALQIYFDFSGYTDIAIGIGRWLNVDFPQNFRHPYNSIGFSDFWSRWHISLSSWLRDYLYIPLGGSRKGELRTHVNLWITMLASGLWHGAGLTYLAWGCIHAALLSFERLTKWPTYFDKSHLTRIVGVLITTAIVLLTWVFFRAESITQSLSITASMTNANTFQISDLSRVGSTQLLLLITFLTWEMFCWLLPREKLEKWQIVSQLEWIFYALLAVTAIIFRGPGLNFVYFQF